MSMKGSKTTEVGSQNRNDQIVERKTGLAGNDHNQIVYELSCTLCGHHYGSNGSDIFQRKCPRCQGGMPGLPFTTEATTSVPITLEAFRSFVAELKGAPLRTIGDGKSFTVFPTDECVRFVLESGVAKPLSLSIFKKSADIFNATRSYTTTGYHSVTGLSSYILGVFRAMAEATKATGPSVTVSWKKLRTKDILPLEWFTGDSQLIGVIHKMRGSLGRDSGEAQCDVTKDGLVALLDYRPAAYRKFNKANSVEFGVVRLTFTDLERTKPGKVEWQAEGEDSFTAGGEFEFTYELPPAPVYLPPTEPATKVQQWVRPRPGQSLFKISLTVAYENRCCVTKCQVKEVLEAAHIDDYLAPGSDNISNGLLLRSDLHALFDANLLAIEPVTHLVYLAPAVVRDAAYAELNGHKIYLPQESTHRPNYEALKRRWEKFKAARS